MTWEFEVSLQERTKPYGVILENETTHKEDYIFEWDPRLKMSIPTGESKIDPEHILADGVEYMVLDKGNCRSCHKKIKPYTETYYAKRLDYCGPHCIAYGMKNDYCEECAKEKSRFAHVQSGLPTIVKTEEREEFGSGEFLQKTYYSDGSVVEDMTMEEKQRAHITQELNLVRTGWYIGGRE